MQKIFQNLLRWHPFLTQIGFANAILAIICFALMGMDDRTLLGVSVWLKPMKFAMSLAIFSWTIVWLIHVYNYSEKWTKRAGNFFGVLTLIEIFTILFPASQGQLSHYNDQELIYSINWATMGIAIHLTAVGLLVMAVQSFFRKIDAKTSMKWAIRFGWICLFFSFFGGEIMVNQAGHKVGVPQDSDGLPLTNWSTIGGDLRVMHFFGLHAIQLLPLIAYFLEEKQIFKNETLRTAAVIMLGLWYLSWVGYLYFQALDGLPFLKV